MITKKIPCEIFSRVVGYFRPVNQWNKAKQQEFSERKKLRYGAPPLRCSCGGEIHELSKLVAVCVNCGDELSRI